MDLASLQPACKRRRRVLSPWVTLLEVEVADGSDGAVFHGMEVSDYAVVCARTRSGLIPVVRQFRPILGSVTLEFPSGHVDDGETPDHAAGREFLEETGLTAKHLVKLGSHWTDTGRLTNRTHAYFTQADDPVSRESREAGVELEFLNQNELEVAIEEGRFGHFLHVGAYALAKARGLV